MKRQGIRWLLPAYLTRNHVNLLFRKKSSCVARERRTQINQTLYELGTILCPDQDRLDKLTVVRLAAATIKLHTFLKGVDQNRPCQRLQHQRPSLTRHFAKILPGFVIILSASGQVLYVSDSIKDTLEHSPHSVVGEYIHSLVHPDDHDEVNRNLVKETSFMTESSVFNRKRKCTRESSSTVYHTSDKGASAPETTDMEVEMGGTPHLPCGYSDLNSTDNNTSLRVLHPLSKTLKRRFFCRMKCLQQRKFKRLVKSWGYKTVYCSGYQIYDTKEGGMLSCKGFIGHVRPLQPPAIFEIPLVDGSFMTHHSLDLNFIFTDKRLQTALGYLPEEVLGKSIYNFVHNDDLNRLARFHKNLLDKGECISGYYRLAVQDSTGWVTVQSQANIIYNKKEHLTPDYIVSINYIIGQTSPQTETVELDRASSDTLNRSNVVMETAPRPVQIDELLESGVFTTSTGEKAVPAQITRHAAQMNSLSFYPSVHPHDSSRGAQPHQYPSYVITPQVIYNPDAFAREMELSTHTVSQIRRHTAATQPVRIPIVRDGTSLPLDIAMLPRDMTQREVAPLPRDSASLPRDSASLPLDVRHLPVPRVQHDISELNNASYPVPSSGTPYFPIPFSQTDMIDPRYSSMRLEPPAALYPECNEPNFSPHNIYLQSNTFQYTRPIPQQATNTPLIGNYLRYLEDDQMYYDSNRVS